MGSEGSRASAVSPAQLPEPPRQWRRFYSGMPSGREVSTCSSAAGSKINGGLELLAASPRGGFLLFLRARRDIDGNLVRKGTHLHSRSSVGWGRSRFYAETNPISTRSQIFGSAERCDHPRSLEVLTSRHHSSGPSLLQTCARCSEGTRPSRKGSSPPSESSGRR